MPAIVAATSSQPNGNFDAIRIDVCRANRRVYAWFFNTFCGPSGCNEANATPSTLFTSANATGAWTAISMTSPPVPVDGLYDSGFAVAANSPGDGSNDILFFGAVDLYRSTNSGGTWLDTNSDEIHADYHDVRLLSRPAPCGDGARDVHRL